MRISTLVVCLFAMNFFTFSQIIQSGNLENHLNAIITTLPGANGNEYTSPTSNELLDWNVVINDILLGNYSNANTGANALDYDLIEYTDLPSSEIHHILQEKVTSTKFWGTYVFNAAPCRENLILQSPHSKFDFNTGKESVYCYTRLNAKSLFINGTHRCNHSDLSTCDGTTTSCSGSSSAFSISDMAHNTNSIFQATTSALFNQNSNSIFIQLHGFTKQPTDPYVIMSNGTRETPANDVILSIQSELELIDNVLTFKIAHIDQSWTRLIAFTNTQGRLVNNSTNHCNSAATMSNGNFVHIEQEKDRLRLDATGWDKIKLALENVFQCNIVGIEGGIISEKLIVSPNPTSKDEISITSEKFQKIIIRDTKGKEVFIKGYNHESSTQIDVTEFKKGMYFIQIFNKKGVIQSKLIIK